MSDQALFPIVDGRYTMDSEPIVRIGVVLPEDAKRDMRLSLPPGSYTTALAKGAAATREADGPARPLESHGILRVAADGDAVTWTNGVGEPERVPAFVLQPVGEQTGDHPGTMVHGLIAGRSFHWRKEIDVALTGALRFAARDGRLLMMNELPLEEYLLGVITGEMSGDCPPEFMKAQAVAARSWFLAQPRSPHPGEPFHWCNDDCCQRYQGTGGWTPQARAALAECRGEVLITPSNHYCDARYSKNCGGISEDATSVWGEAMECLTAIVDAPAGSEAERFFPVTDANVEEYIRGEWAGRCDAYGSPDVVRPEDFARYLGRVDEAGSYFRWEWTLSQDEMVEALRTRGGLKEIAEVLDLRPGSRGRSGRLERLTVVYRDKAGAERSHTIQREYWIRASLSMKFLYSSAFLVEPRRDAKGRLVAAHLRGAGWGHGAGLCQMGALGRALRGQSYREILAAYFPAARLEAIYS